MTNTAAEPIQVTFAGEQRRIGDSGRALERGAAAGRFRRVRRGVYAPAAE